MTIVRRRVPNADVYIGPALFRSSTPIKSKYHMSITD